MARVRPEGDFFRVERDVGSGGGMCTRGDQDHQSGPDPNAADYPGKPAAKPFFRTQSSSLPKDDGTARCPKKLVLKCAAHVPQDSNGTRLPATKTCPDRTIACFQPHIVCSLS